jgi:7-carboxy-7-deazaguanine synthase
MKMIFLLLLKLKGPFFPTDYPINLFSISPKFSNSVPVIGVATPQGGITDERMVKKHNSKRLNYEAIKQSIAYHSDYHIKPVWDGKDQDALAEIMECIKLN